MFLLAEITDSSALQTGTTVLSVIAAALSCWFNLLQQRDRLKFDFEKSSLREANERHTIQITELKADSDKCRSERDKLSERLDVERREREQQGREFAQQLLELRERNRE